MLQYNPYENYQQFYPYAKKGFYQLISDSACSNEFFKTDDQDQSFQSFLHRINEI